MPDIMDRYFTAFINSSYDCTGEEIDGIQEAVINGVSYFFYLNNTVAGAKIIFRGGHFYTDTPSMLVRDTASHEEEVIPPTDLDKQIDIQGKGQGGTEQGGSYSGDLPQEVVDYEEETETVITYDADGTPRMYYRYGDELVEIPLIPASEIERVGNRLILKEINYVLNGHTVEVS